MNEDMNESPTMVETGNPLNFYRRQIILRKTTSGSLKIKNEQIFKNNRKTISAKNFDEDTIITILKNHFSPDNTNAVFIDDETVHEKLTEIVNKYFGENENFRIKVCKKILRDITDEDKLVDIIGKEHLKNNHRGINENFNELKTEIYHPQLKLRVTQYINNCDICSKEKYDRKPVKQKFKLTETPENPGEIIHVDVFYSLEKTLFLTFIDKFSKHAQAIKIKSRSWIDFKTALTQYLSTVGGIFFKRTENRNSLHFK